MGVGKFRQYKCAGLIPSILIPVSFLLLFHSCIIVSQSWESVVWECFVVFPFSESTMPQAVLNLKSFFRNFAATLPS